MMLESVSFMVDDLAQAFILSSSHNKNF